MDSSADQSNGVEEVRPAQETVNSTVVNEKARKIFVGGLSQETDSEKLREYFSSYGDIVNTEVKMDKSTGNSRGFGFIVFKTEDTVQKVMDVTGHTISGKKVDVQKPKTKQGKIFIGGLDEQVNEDDIKAHFTTYGTVVEVQRPFDKVKQQKKGFCFVVFEDQSAVRMALRQPKQIVSGKELDVKSANPKSDQNVAQVMYPSYGNEWNQGYAYPMQGGWYGESSSGYQVPNYNNGNVAPGFVNVAAQPTRGGGRGRGTARGRGRFQPY